MNPCDAPCPKCGGLDIHRVFHARGARVESKEYDTPPHSGFNARGWISWAVSDCIVHHCRTCQYEWTGKPLAKARKAQTE
jgi:hypothetical protein